MTNLPDLDKQQSFWNHWNITYRAANPLDPPTLRRKQEVLGAVDQLRLVNARILEVGCGTGWLSKELSRYGSVVAVDLSDESIKYAKNTVPGVEFHTGDIIDLPLQEGSFDVVITVETLSHVNDQKRFIQRLASLLMATGVLILTTQNRFVFERRDDVIPLAPGHQRRWVTLNELERLVGSCFCITDKKTLEPAGHGGILRWVNSYKLNALLSTTLGPDRVKNIKEQLGFGQTLVVVANRK